MNSFPIPSKVIYFIGAADSNWSSDFCSIITPEPHEEIINAFLEWLNANLKCWNELDLNHIPDDSIDFQLLKKKFPHRSTYQFIQDAPSRFLNKAEKMT